MPVALAYLDHGRLLVRSRSGKAMHPWLPELADLAKAAAVHERLILDGEVVTLVNSKRLRSAQLPRNEDYDVLTTSP